LLDYLHFTGPERTDPETLQRGYETAVKGKNGFVYLVDRAWQAPFADPEFWNPKVRAPVCLNPQAARSVLRISWGA
jgi:hypothetical protein